MDNVYVRLGATPAALGLSIRISGCGWGWCLVSRTGGIGDLGQEWFDEVLAGTNIGTWCTRTLWRSVGPLESHLIGDVGGILDGISARTAPDFVVSVAGEEACDDDADDCAEGETANTRSNDDADRDPRTPGKSQPGNQ